MSGKDKPVTTIGSPTSDTSRLIMRGRDLLHDILGRMSFAEAFYFIVTGREAKAMQRTVMDAALIILMDHGITPTAMVARLLKDAVPDQPQVALGAGIMLVGDKFVGTMAGAGAYLLEGHRQSDRRAWARNLVTNAQNSNRRLPGFGHPYYRPTDPRADRLFAVARSAGCAGTFIDLLEMVGEELDSQAGRHLTLNATGALGAILCEIDFPVEAMRGLAAVSRAAGLVAHIIEEAHSPIASTLMDFAGTIEYRDPA